MLGAPWEFVGSCWGFLGGVLGISWGFHGDRDVETLHATSLPGNRQDFWDVETLHATSLPPSPPPILRPFRALQDEQGDETGLFKMGLWVDKLIS